MQWKAGSNDRIRDLDDTFSGVKCQQTFVLLSHLLRSSHGMGAIKHMPVPCICLASVCRTSIQLVIIVSVVLSIRK